MNFLNKKQETNDDIISKNAKEDIDNFIDEAIVKKVVKEVGAANKTSLENFESTVVTPIGECKTEISNLKKIFVSPSQGNYDEYEELLEDYDQGKEGRNFDIVKDCYIQKKQMDNLLTLTNALNDSYKGLSDGFNGLNENYGKVSQNYETLTGDLESIITKYDTQVEECKGLSDKLIGLNEKYGEVSQNYKTLNDNLGSIITKYDTQVEECKGLSDKYKNIVKSYDTIAQTSNKVIEENSSIIKQNIKRLEFVETKQELYGKKLKNLSVVCAFMLIFETLGIIMAALILYNIFR